MVKVTDTKTQSLNVNHGIWQVYVCIFNCHFIHFLLAKNNYCVAHITEIFENETGVDYRIFLGDEKVIEQKKQELLNEDNFVYAIYKVFGFNDVSLVKVVYSDDPIDKEDEKWLNYSIQEIREMDNQEFYQFLKDYERLLFLI